MYIDWNNTYMARKRRAQRMQYEQSMPYKVGQAIVVIAHILFAISCAILAYVLLVCSMLIAQSYR